MQPVERHIYDRITFFLDSNPEKGMMDFFSANYADHLAKLKLEEFKVIDSVDTKSALLSARTQLELRKETTSCRNQILNSSRDVFFKRKNFLVSVQETRTRNGFSPR